MTEGPAPGLARRAFWFLRHGETDWNARNLSQGNVDIPLNPTGIAQAERAATRLVGQGIASIVASPLSRASRTAEIIGLRLGRPFAIDPDLREAAYGVREGQPMEDWFRAWIDGTATPAGAEIFADLRRRASAAINRALGHPAPVLVVGHGGMFRALRAEMGLPIDVRTPNATPILCSPGPETWSLTPL